MAAASQEQVRFDRLHVALHRCVRRDTAGEQLRPERCQWHDTLHHVFRQGRTIETVQLFVRLRRTRVFDGSLHGVQFCVEVPPEAGVRSVGLDDDRLWFGIFSCLHRVGELCGPQLAHAGLPLRECEVAQRPEHCIQVIQ